jgi:surfactin synthase thioesterase subunit
MFAESKMHALAVWIPRRGVGDIAGEWVAKINRFALPVAEPPSTEANGSLHEPFAAECRELSRTERPARHREPAHELALLGWQLGQAIAHELLQRLWEGRSG